MFKRIGQDAQIAYECATYDTTTVNISHRNLTHLLNFQYERINFKIHDFYVSVSNLYIIFADK